MTVTPTDPIFKKIEAHRDAVHAWQAAGDISGKMLADDPAEDAANRATTKASGAEMRALRTLLQCPDHDSRSGCAA